MYLQKENTAAAVALLNSPLWIDLKKCLLERRPEAPGIKEQVHTQAAQGFRRSGYEEAIATLEKLPFDLPLVTPSPFDRPALETAD